MDCTALPAAIVQTVAELMKSDSENEKFEIVVTGLALKLTRLQRNRIPKYCQELPSRYITDAPPVFTHGRRQSGQDGADSPAYMVCCHECANGKNSHAIAEICLN
ncbi:hypothetical protein HPB50_012237 [Hyalomma asiaticum]|uniref:Uncharacterized protein n=1 Tax=Hyalomma asiaticum TaxID=266040 RepID=A0ACB7T9W9_HYAAI|nr:hypothetical protein HPB50_012237 [Hyalomma asiaticum]